MKFGLPEYALDELKRYFASKPAILEVRIFGSRALGTAEKGSDIDFAIITTEDHDISSHVKGDLDELKLPYLFDVVDLKFVVSTSLRDHIERVGKLFYPSPPP
ncbi:MAG: nucleotidyltransferase domain-containing protein [Oligoflexales bacterium]|nr:nucleotidyltransferase domain-containing protein [Oligoflexales bacterium]